MIGLEIGKGKGSRVTTATTTTHTPHHHHATKTASRVCRFSDVPITVAPGSPPLRPHPGLTVSPIPRARPGRVRPDSPGVDPPPGHIPGAVRPDPGDPPGLPRGAGPCRQGRPAWPGVIK